MEAELPSCSNVSTTQMASSKTEAEKKGNEAAHVVEIPTDSMGDNRRFLKVHKTKLDTEDVQILVLILDIDFGQGYIQPGKVEMVFNMLDAAMVLANGHLLERPRNEVGVIACSRNIVMLAHSIDVPLTSYDYQLDTIMTMEYEVLKKVKAELFRDFSNIDADQVIVDNKKPSLLAEALELALCYIQKRRRQIPDIYPRRRVQAQIVIVTGSVLQKEVHKRYDNLIQEALETNVTINVCGIKVPKQQPLQRATEVTDGLYLCIDDTFSLVGSLVDHYLYPTFLVKAVKPHITTPARCACHGFANKIGFVCSKCKLVLCKYSPYCDDCLETQEPLNEGAIICKNFNPNGIVFPIKKKPKHVHIVESHIARHIQSNDSELRNARRIHSIVRIAHASGLDLNLGSCGFF
ncbi:general transcription factor IIH subunit 3-like [Drosophila subobscura]|uniref:general transcription factor IIH subunit 3-like n=1 Tax=Drosophila subobscura TaxID=7241 RepID=UPI00155AC28F|nr:general transcription factor IIH subunit 3-like [Drosophila subobscura]